jgi:hypothetical protein
VSSSQKPHFSQTTREMGHPAYLRDSSRTGDAGQPPLGKHGRLRFMNCWAACLGGCSDKISREHLVSESLFMNEKVTVQGLPWCKEPKEIGISALTAKILCVKHNNDLPPIDTAGAKAFATLREIRRLANVRAKIKPGPRTVKKYRIDGVGLERWFLKTLINICCDREYPIGRNSQIAGWPSDELVRIAYSLDSFKDRAGLYFLAKVGMKVNSTDTVSFTPLIHKNGLRVECGLFSFRGQGFLLALEPEDSPHPLHGVMLNGEDLGGAQLNFHNEQIFVNEGKYRSQVLKVDW